MHSCSRQPAARFSEHRFSSTDSKPAPWPIPSSSPWLRPRWVPWNVTSGSVDWLGAYWQPASGTGSLDLSGWDPGTIQTTLSTVAGQTYNLSFALSGNPDYQSNKELLVSVGDFSGSFYFDSTGHTRADMGWVTKTISFVASGNDILTFVSTAGNGHYGPALDDIAVSTSAVPEPATCALAGLGLCLAAFWRRRTA